MESNRPDLSIVLGLIAYALLNTGMGTQKHAAEIWFSDLSVWSRTQRPKLGIWLLGLLQVGLALLLLPLSISCGSISTVAPLSGFGLLVLALFSRFVLCEVLDRRDLGGIGAVALGTLWLGFHLAPSPARPVETSWLWVSMGLALSLAGLACWIALRHRRSWIAPVFSAAAAVLATFTLFFPKLFAADLALLERGAAPALRALAGNPYAYLYVLFNVGALIPLQVAYRHGRAAVVVPIYSSLTLLLPILGAVLLFGERLPAAQILGIVVILGGVALLSSSGRAEVS